MKMIFLLLITAFTTPSFAKMSSDTQSWKTLSFKTKLQNLRLAVQTEVRYSEENTQIFEEHIKPYLGYKTSVGEFGFVFSYLTSDSFSKEFEKRYAFQYGFKAIKNYYIDYKIRYRYEFRDFKDQPEIAQRTRLRNQVKLSALKAYKWIPFISSELNFYLNDTSKGLKGFSSHRTLVGFQRNFKKFNLSIGYINNYKVKNKDSNMTQALGLGLSFHI